MGILNKLKNIFNTKEKEDLKTYEEGLEKTRSEFSSKLSNLNLKHKLVNDEYFIELEELLINADIGVSTTFSFLEKLNQRVKKESIKNTDELKEIIIDELFMLYVGEDILTDKININPNGPTIILVVGVNGVGKTTSIAKLAHKYNLENKKTLLIAGDTFRAGAVEQLKLWAKRTNSEFYGNDNTDPSSVIFDGLKLAIANNTDIVLIDTAGRLDNKTNLMNELEKINKVINGVLPGAPHETLLVIDASTGQNGIVQAENFKKITNITGIVLTKLDGTAKGGIVLAIKDKTKLPVKFVGFGEKETDLKVFDIESYIYGLFKDVI